MITDWWETFFSGPVLDIQRKASREEKTRTEADFIEKVLQIIPQGKILDVPCGEGRLSLEMASRGYSVTGVDITLPFLEDAKRKASEKQLEITWEHRDMRDLPWKEEFDAVICFGGSFGYFDDEGNKTFLKAVFSTLKPEGTFLIDTHVAETLLPRFQERDWHRIGDTLIAEEREYDHVHGRVRAEWILIQGSTLEKRSSSVRMYTYCELVQMLEKAGFYNYHAYGSLGVSPFRVGSQRLYLTAKKKGH